MTRVSTRAAFMGLAVALVACESCGATSEEPPAQPTHESSGDESDESSEPEVSSARQRMSEREDERHAMVREQIEGRRITDPRVLAALRSVPRHLFVPPSQEPRAYLDRPLAIGHDQTISQPYIVALMSELAEVREGAKVLEIGTGSGYQAAVLAAMGAEVYSIEIVEPLGLQARDVLDSLGYDVNVRVGDGYAGWPEAAPFDVVLLTAAPPEIPEPLLEQLAVGGRLIAPVGGRGAQELIVVTRGEAGFERRRVIPVRFVPMTGRAQGE